MKKISFMFLLCAAVLFSPDPVCADTGYELWLNYSQVEDKFLRGEYLEYFDRIHVADCLYKDVIESEFRRAVPAMLSAAPVFTGDAKSAHILFTLNPRLRGSLNTEGYTIKNRKRGGRNIIEVTAAGGEGLLYGAFHLLRLVQTGAGLRTADISEIPAVELRMLNHWDDLNGHIERGYAGPTLWQWDELPGTSDRKYTDYARANASIGINATVLNNVNADPRLLRTDYLHKVAALADVFRKYNIKVYLSANFAACMKPSDTPDVMRQWGGVGNLDTADPLDPEVRAWWADKAEEIYSLIPDFGGFLVKANSEGMPGPQDYGRTHADGANMLARALEPFGGVVLWRTFVYEPDVDPDRSKRSYKEFMPLDGMFDDNVILQTKNGPLDFQACEPAQPLFGGIKNTALAPELQIMQEYTGRTTYLVYLLPMWKQFYGFDTWCEGEGSTVSEIVRGNIYKGHRRAIAGVANVGNSPNWTLHHFAQANWYAFGRLAWNPDEDETVITRNWIKSTWNCSPGTVDTIEKMMTGSWEAFARSSSPYGIGFTVEVQGHYRADFEFRAGRFWYVGDDGIGYDRTSRGTDYVSQYYEPNRSTFDNIETCPEDLLLYFHYAPWNHTMRSGLPLSEELMAGLRAGVDKAKENMALWASVEGEIDGQRHRDVSERLEKELSDATLFYEKASAFFMEYVVK